MTSPGPRPRVRFHQGRADDQRVTDLDDPVTGSNRRREQKPALQRNLRPGSGHTHTGGSLVLEWLPGTDHDGIGDGANLRGGPERSLRPTPVVGRLAPIPKIAPQLTSWVGLIATKCHHF